MGVGLIPLNSNIEYLVELNNMPMSDFPPPLSPLGMKSPGKMMALHHARGDSNFLKMRPFRRGRYFDKVRPFVF